MIAKIRGFISSNGIVKGILLFLRYCLCTFTKIFGAKILNRICGLKKIIVLKGQMDFEGNCKALYYEFLKCGLNREYKIVWHIDNGANKIKIDEKYATIITKKNWLRSIYYNATASYVFFEVNCCFQRRVNGQKIIYLGHGCPSIKNCKGFITLNDKLVSNAVITSENVRDIMAYMFEYPKDRFLINGMPRNDIIVNSKNNFSNYGIKRGLKVIIWMPTFRESNIVLNNVRRIDSDAHYLYGLPLIHNESDLQEINERLAEYNLLLLIKPHPRALCCSIESISYSNIKVWTNEFLSENNIDLYSLFKDSAALLSDYSSVSFDYILSNNPIGYIVDDMESYKIGFAYKNALDYMPGHHIKNIEDLVSFFADISSGRDPYCQERQKINAWANTYNDGRNAARLIKLVGINKTNYCFDSE